MDFSCAAIGSCENLKRSPRLPLEGIDCVHGGSSSRIVFPVARRVFSSFLTDDEYTRYYDTELRLQPSLPWKRLSIKTFPALHKRYDPIIRVFPNELQINDLEVYHQSGLTPSSIFMTYPAPGSGAPDRIQVTSPHTWDVRPLFAHTPSHAPMAHMLCSLIYSTFTLITVSRPAPTPCQLS